MCCISLITYDTEHLFVCLLNIHISSLEKYLFISLAHFNTELFFYYSVHSFLSYLDAFYFIFLFCYVLVSASNYSLFFPRQIPTLTFTQIPNACLYRRSCFQWIVEERLNFPGRPSAARTRVFLPGTAKDRAALC